MGGGKCLYPVTGKYYFDDSAGNFINIFAENRSLLSPTSFGLVLGVYSITYVLYAQATNGLNIVSGLNDKDRKNRAPFVYAR